jgi:hypothetical protein
MVLLMTWKPKRREPEKTKAELREMLAKAVRNTTQPKTNTEPSPKTKKGRRYQAVQTNLGSISDRRTSPGH